MAMRFAFLPFYGFLRFAFLMQGRLYFALLKKLFCRAFTLPLARNNSIFALPVSTWYTKNKRLLHCAICVLRLYSVVRFCKVRFIMRFFAVLLAFLFYAKTTMRFVT